MHHQVGGEEPQGQHNGHLGPVARVLGGRHGAHEPDQEGDVGEGEQEDGEKVGQHDLVDEPEPACAA